MREFSWHIPDNTRVREAYKLLEDTYNTSEDLTKVHYKDIFDSCESELDSLLGFVRKQTSSEFPKNFPDQLKWLIDVIKGIDRSEFHRDADRADLFPRKRLLWLSIVLYATGVVYCLARLSIIALAFSSLRLMADSVYETTWTKTIPNVQ